MSTGIQLAGPEIIAYVGPGEEYSNINDALTALSRVRQAHKSGGAIAEVRLVSGFAMSERVEIRAVDLGWVTIRADDATVPMDASSTFLVTHNSRMPIIGCLFDMAGETPDSDHTAINMRESWVMVLPGCGVQNAIGRACEVTNASVLSANGSIWSDADDIAVRPSNNSVAYLRESNCDNAGRFGIRPGNGCVVHCVSASAQNCGNFGLSTSGAAFVSGQSSNFSGSGMNDVALSGTGGGIINVTGATYASLSHVPNLLTGDGIIIIQDAVSKNSGIASLTGDGSTVTDSTVAHGLDSAPALADISVTPNTSLGAASEFWVSAVDAMNITITVDADPGSSVQVDFAWQAELT